MLSTCAASCEKRLGCCRMAATTQIDIDDLALRIDGPLELAPALADLHLRFIHPPATANWQALCTSGRDEVWGKGLDPVVDSARINTNTSLSQQLRDIGGTEAKMEGVADCQNDDLVRKSIAAKQRGGPGCDTSTTQAALIELAATPVAASLHPAGARLLACTPITLHPEPLRLPLPSRTQCTLPQHGPTKPPTVPCAPSASDTVGVAPIHPRTTTAASPGKSETTAFVPQPAAAPVRAGP